MGLNDIKDVDVDPSQFFNLEGRLVAQIDVSIL